MKKIPLFYFLRSFSRRESKFTYSLYVSIFLVCIFIISLTFSSVSRNFILKQKHLALRSFAQWAAFQIVPLMYGFDNTLYFDQASFRVNHYPLSYVTFHNNRFLLSSIYGQESARVLSKYLNNERETEYLFVPTGKGYKVLIKKVSAP